MCISLVFNVHTTVIVHISLKSSCVQTNNQSVHFMHFPSPVLILSQLFKDGSRQSRLISVVDVVITPMNPYQPILFHILSFAVFQSRILIYAGSNIYDDEIAEEKVFERKDRFS